MNSIDFCNKCWSPSLIHAIIPSNDSKTKRFTKILQCSVCRHWYTLDKIAIEDKKHPIIKTDAYENVVISNDEEVDEECKAKGVQFQTDTQSYMDPGIFGVRGFKVILKNCKIHAENIIIKTIEDKLKK